MVLSVIIIIKHRGIIAIKIFLRQNLLLVPFAIKKYKGIIGIKIFLRQNVLLVPI